MSQPAAARRRERVIRRRWGRLGRAAAYGTVVALVVGALGAAARLKLGVLVDADEAVIRWATDLVRPHPALRSLLARWQEATMPVGPYAVAALLAVLIWFRAPRYRTRALWAVLTCLLGWGLANLVKEIARRARPVVPDPIELAPGYSFPSGHAMNAAIVAAVLVLLVRPWASRRWRRLSVVTAVLYAGLTGVHRVLLGVHYPSDVVAGWILGAGFVLASYAGYVDWRPPDHADGDAASETASDEASGTVSDPRNGSVRR